MADDDIKVSVEVDTGDSADDIERVRDVSKEAGEALDELDGGGRRRIEAPGATDAAEDLDRLDRAARNVDPTVAVDVDVDQAAIRDAADEIEDLDRKARGAGDGLGFTNSAVRDLAGPLGDSVGNAGDLGDAFEGLGDIAAGLGAKLGLSAEAASKAGTAIAGVGVIVAVAVGAWNLYKSGQEKARQETEKLIEVQQKLRDQKIDDAAADIVEQYGDLIGKLRELGYSATDFIETLQGSDDLLQRMHDREREFIAAYADGTALKSEMFDQVGFPELIANIEGARDAWQGANGELSQTTAITDEVAAALGGVTSEADDAADSVDRLTRRFELMGKALDARATLRDVKDAFDDVAKAAVDAWTKAGEGTVDAEDAVRDYEAAQDALREKVLTFADTVKGIPPEQVTRILALIDDGDFAAAEARFDDLTKTRTVEVATTVDTAGLDEIDRRIAGAIALWRSLWGSANASPGDDSSGSGGTYSGGRRITSAGGVTNNYWPPTIGPADTWDAWGEYRRQQGFR